MKSTLAALILFAPFARAAGEAVKNPDTYIYLSVGDIRSLDPAGVNDIPTQLVQRNVYETLFFPAGSSAEKLAPLLAESVPSIKNHLISSDRKTYTIPIRRGIRFHDGTPLTAEDVRYSLLRNILRDNGDSANLLEAVMGLSSTRDPQGRPWPGLFDKVGRAIRVDGRNVVITLEKPFVPFLAILARYGRIVSKEWARKQGDWDGETDTWLPYHDQKIEESKLFARENGTGPFKVERWDRSEKTMILVRNDQYWRGPAKLKRVIVRGIGEFQTRKLMLAAGDADAIAAPRPMLSQLKNLQEVEIIDGLPSLSISPIAWFTFTVDGSGNRFLGSGQLDGEGIPANFLSDLDIRRGFAFSFDYNRFIQETMGGKGRQAVGTVPSALLSPHKHHRLRVFDAARAAEHFQKAFGGEAWRKGFRLTMVYPTGNDSAQGVCEIFKKNVEALNPKFKIDIQGLDWPAFFAGLTGKRFPLWIAGDAGYGDPHALAKDIDSNSKYSGGYKNKEVDRLIREAVQEFDAKKRAALYERLLEIEYDDVPRIEIMEPVEFHVQRSWVKGWYPNPLMPDGGYFYSIYKAG